MDFVHVILIGLGDCLLVVLGLGLWLYIWCIITFVTNNAQLLLYDDAKRSFLSKLHCSFVTLLTLVDFLLELIWHDVSICWCDRQSQFGTLNELVTFSALVQIDDKEREF